MVGMMKQWFQNGFLWALESNISTGWKIACLIYDALRVIMGGPYQLIVVIGVNRVFSNENDMILFHIRFLLLLLKLKLNNNILI